MIVLILGTSEGKKILSLLNQYTDDILISTATAYGGELLKEFRYKKLNDKPLNLEQLEELLEENHIELLIDASHPYALEIRSNAIEVCKQLNIPYIRYDRQSIAEKYKESSSVTIVKDYEELKKCLVDQEGTILNTTGSRHMEKLLGMNLPNRIVHRVLPSVEVMEKCFSLKVKTEDIVAIKGPISYELNCSFIKACDAKSIILKDSGALGGTEEKIKAAMHLGIQAYVLGRTEIKYDFVFNNEADLVEYIVKLLRLQEE